MNYKVMPSKKQKIINETLKFLLNEIEQVEPHTAQLLREKINSKQVSFKILPKQKAINSKEFGDYKMETKGLTTTFYYPQTGEVVRHVITLPEEQFFAIHNGKIAVKKQGIVTLLHELKHLSRAGFEGPTLLEELEADLFTVKMLKKLRLKKEEQEYMGSRPVFKKLINKYKERKAREIKARILEEEKAKKGFFEKILGTSKRNYKRL